MAQVLQPWQLFVSILAGWINEHQQAAIEYLREENRVLKEQLGGKRLRLTDDQRRRLAAKGKKLGRRVLKDLASIVTPDTILRWHRQLIAQKWTHQRRSIGRPRTMREIAKLAVQMARENSLWGYGRIQGALENLGHRVGRTTIASILKDHGIEPAPERGKRMTWSKFLKAHWSVLAAADFFTIEVWGPRGLATFYVFFVIELATRRLEIAGITPGPNEAWMMQVGRNLTDPVDGFLRHKEFLIIDRDSKYSLAFRTLLNNSGVEVVRLPPRSPNLNAYAERFVRSIKRERNHQGLDNRLIDPVDDKASYSGAVSCSDRLGGMLRFYHRVAA